MLSITHREAAIFDDASTVPTPCLLLPGYTNLTCLNKAENVRFFTKRGSRFISKSGTFKSVPMHTSESYCITPYIYL